MLNSMEVKIHWITKQIHQHLSSPPLSSPTSIESIETRLEYINLILTTIRLVQWNALSLPEWIDVLHQCRLIESLKNVWPKYAFHEKLRKAIVSFQCSALSNKHSISMFSEKKVWEKANCVWNVRNQQQITCVFKPNRSIA